MRPRLPIVALMGVVALIAIATAALRDANENSASLVFTIAAGVWLTRRAVNTSDARGD